MFRYSTATWAARENLWCSAQLNSCERRARLHKIMQNKFLGRFVPLKKRLMMLLGNKMVWLHCRFEASKHLGAASFSNITCDQWLLQIHNKSFNQHFWRMRKPSEKSKQAFWKKCLNLAHHPSRILYAHFARNCNLQSLFSQTINFLKWTLNSTKKRGGVFVLGPLRLILTDFDKFNRSGPIKSIEEELLIYALRVPNIPYAGILKDRKLIPDIKWNIPQERDILVYVKDHLGKTQ